MACELLIQCCPRHAPPGARHLESSLTTSTRTSFHVGQIIHHKLFDYRGVVVDVDAEFQGTDEWYEQMARSRPPKHEPWYHVLVHDAGIETYVAEQNLERDPSGEPVQHPQIAHFFGELKGGVYVSRQAKN